MAGTRRQLIGQGKRRVVSFSVVAYSLTLRWDTLTVFLNCILVHAPSYMTLRIATFFLLSCGLLSAAEEIRFTASDLLSKFVEPLLIDASESEEQSIDFDGIGSLPALDRLRADEIDMAIIAVPDDQSVPNEEFRIYPFAYAISVILMNEGNPNNEFTLAELSGIFAKSAELKLDSWGDLGLAGWGNRSFKPMVVQSEYGISLELFKHVALKGGSIKSSVGLVREGEIEALLSADVATVGVDAKLPKSRFLKAAMIAKTEDRPAYGPSPDNIHFGDYPMRLPFYIAFNQRDEARVEWILRVLFSDEMAKQLESNGLVPLPTTVRKKLLIDLDLEK